MFRATLKAPPSDLSMCNDVQLPIITLWTRTTVLGTEMLEVTGQILPVTPLFIGNQRGRGLYISWYVNVCVSAW